MGVLWEYCICVAYAITFTCRQCCYPCLNLTVFVDRKKYQIFIQKFFDFKNSMETDK